MAKTTINLEDEIYKKLVREALERYGTTRTLSRLINEKFKEMERLKTKAETAKKMNIVEKTFGAWGKGSTGKEFVSKLRKESEERLKRLGL